MNITMWRMAAAILGLCLLGALIYWPVHQFGFLNYDDPVYVQYNPFVQSGFNAASLHYAFATAAFANWAPFVFVSFLLDKQLFNATAPLIHIENVILHALGGVVLFLLLVKLTASYWRSLLVAALFICHPMHVESVAWVSGRKDVLSTPLLFAAMLTYSIYCRSNSVHRKRWIYGLTLLLFIFSLMTKAMGVTFPLLLLLLDYWPLHRMPMLSLRDRNFRNRLIEKVPMVVVTAIFCLVSLRAQQAGGATDAGQVLPLSDRIENAVVCYVIYAVKLAVPTHLAAFYPHPGFRPVGAVVTAAGVLGLTTWTILRLKTQAPYLIVGWLWFLISLLPVIGIVQIGGQAMADRYSYLPSVGLFIAVVWSASDLAGRIQRASRVIATSISLVVLAIFSVLCHRQVWYWKDARTLFTHSYQVTGPNPVANFMIGVADYMQGDRISAVDNFNIVVEQDPGNDKAFKLLGDIWVEVNVKTAIDCYEKAVAIEPGKTAYRIALAVAYTRLGDTASLNRAVQQLLQVLKVDPNNTQAQAGLVDLHSRLTQNRHS